MSDEPRPPEMPLYDILKRLRTGEIWGILVALAGVATALATGSFWLARSLSSEPHLQPVVSDTDALATLVKVVDERSAAVAQLENAKQELGEATTERKALHVEIGRLNASIEESSKRASELKKSAGVVYFRRISTNTPFDLRGTTYSNYVRLEGERFVIETWAYLPALRKVRRLDLKVLPPAFYPGNRVCAASRCGTVEAATPGVVPFYRVTIEGGKPSEVWTEDVLDSPQTWRADADDPLHRSEGTFER